MARETVVAMDFLGLGKSLGDSDSQLISEERGKLVKPMASLPAAPEQGSSRGPAGEGERESSRSRFMLGADRSPYSGPLAFSLATAMPWASMAGKAEEMERGGLAGRAAVEKAGEEKPLDELTDADIMQLSGEDCRRYMMQIMKGREMPRPALNNKVSVKQPLMTYRARQGEEKPVIKRGGSAIKNGLPETSVPSGQSGPAVQHDIAGPSSSPGVRNGFQAPRYNLQSQSSLGEDVHGGTRPSERAVHALESNLSLSIPSSREQPLAQSSGFGSPVPTFLRMLRPPDHPQRAPQVNHPSQGSGAQVGALSRSTGQNHLPGRPPTAQLTIFYSGMVNVYDNVPADKAQAIMLLAGSGSSWSSSVMNPPAVPVRPPSTGGMASSSNSPARSAPAPAVAAVSQAGPATSPSVPTISVAAGLKPVVGRPTLHAELPQARKASLARFLEKRKDRVRGKAPYMPSIPSSSLKKDVGSSTPPRDKSPSPSNAKPTRSPSPANAASPMNAVSRKRSSSPAQRSGVSQPGASETSSPPKRLGTTQQLPQPSSSEDQASTSAPQRSSKEDRMDWRSEQHSHLSSQGQKLEPMEEEIGSPSQRH